MKVLLFIENKTGNSKDRLLKMVSSAVPASELEYIQDFKQFKESLCRVPREITAVVLLAADRGQLLKLVDLKTLMEDLRVILVVAGKDVETVANGHLLRPRMLTFADQGFYDVAAVLKKIRAKYP